MEGKKVRLRAIEKTDIDEVMKWINDPEVVKYIGYPVYPFSRYQEERWLERILDEKSPDKVFVIETKNGVYLGGIGLHQINWHNRSAMVGIVIGKKEYWDKGYGTDAMRIILDLAFNRMNLHRVGLNVYDFNQRAVKSYEKCGFKKEGVLREGYYYGGKYHDVVVMGILKKEFKKR
ncbi:MAG: hypothetical protein AMJ90_05730 [candidate division Zixibacteria bacterium SM23_73_2]|nr:MAG: hypothetical protein AMJ90_05730 [candidate division Zixibacteria bacterium SM23_73_2]